jgi:hypothetical protein
MARAFDSGIWLWQGARLFDGRGICARACINEKWSFVTHGEA